MSAEAQYLDGVAAVAAALLASSIIVTVAGQSGSVPATMAAEAEAYLRRGEQEAGGHEYDKAIADYTQAIRLRPDYAEAYNDRGHAYHWKGNNSDRAIADFARAIELRPNYPTAYNNRGVVYMARGETARSIAEFDRALQLNPNYRNAYVNRANAQLRLLHVRAALNDFHRANMYPERVVAGLAVTLLFALGGTVAVRRARRRSGSRAKPA